MFSVKCVVVIIKSCGGIMSSNGENLLKLNPLVMESSMAGKHSKLRALPLLVLSTLLFIGYVSNILLGMLAIQYAVAVPYLVDLWEFLMLFGAAAGFIIFILLNEKDKP